MGEAIFPIMVGHDPREAIKEARASGGMVLVIGLPWAMIEPHEAQAKRNHGGQTLKRLAERGGLSAGEAVAVLNDGPYQRMAKAAAQFRLSALVARWTADKYRAEEQADWEATGGF